MDTGTGPLFCLDNLHSKVVYLADSPPALKKELKARGATFVDSLTKEVDLLVVKNPLESRESQSLAIAMGIPILTEGFLAVNLHTKPTSIASTKRTRDSPARKEAPKRHASQSRVFAQIQENAANQVVLQRAKKKAHEESQIYLNHVVALEGNIGAGKSTLCGKLKDLYQDKCALYKEQGNEKFLQLFYSNPAKYGFAYQWGMLKTRKFQLKLAQKDLKHGRVPPKQFYFWDRSMVGDYIFALWNHLQGSISPSEMAVYENEFGGCMKDPETIAFLSEVNCYILLNDEPAACKRRVEDIRGNKSESGIPLAYYEGIDDIHFDLFVKRIMPRNVAPTLSMSWGDYNDPSSIWELMERVMEKKQAIPFVKILDKEEPIDKADDNFIYKSEEEILGFYQTVLCPHFVSPKKHKVESHAKKYKNVYIPIDAMVIPPKEKGQSSSLPLEPDSLLELIGDPPGSPLHGFEIPSAMHLWSICGYA